MRFVFMVSKHSPTSFATATLFDPLYLSTPPVVPPSFPPFSLPFPQGSNDFYLKVSTQAARVPTKALRLKVGEEWKEGTPVHGSYFEFRDGAPFSFPIEVEVTSVFGEVLKDEIVSLQVRREGGREGERNREEGRRGGARTA